MQAIAAAVFAVRGRIGMRRHHFQFWNALPTKLAYSWIRAVGLSLLVLMQPVRAQGAVSPLSLERFVAEAVAAHPGVSAKRAGVNEAEADVDAARSQYLPTPSIQVNQRSDGRQVASLILSQPLWAAGRLDANLEAAEARKRSAEDAVSETQTALALRAVDLWQQYLSSRGRQAALRAGVDRLREFDDMMRRRFENGASAAVDLELGHARLAQARSDLVLEESVGHAVLSQLSQLAGRPIGDEAIGRRSAVMVPEDEAALVERALSVHPALRRTGAEIEAAVSDAERQRAARWPTLSLQAEHRSDETVVHRESNAVFLVLQYQPGAGLSAAAAVRGAEFRAESLRKIQEATRRDIVENLKLDFERYRSARARAGDVQGTVDASREILASYQRLFLAGKRSWLDVVNAAREQTQAELAMADIDAAVVVAPYRLKLRAGDMSWIQQ